MHEFGSYDWQEIDESLTLIIDNQGTCTAKITIHEELDGHDPREFMYKVDAKSDSSCGIGVITIDRMTVSPRGTRVKWFLTCEGEPTDGNDCKVLASYTVGKNKKIADHSKAIKAREFVKVGGNSNDCEIKSPLIRYKNLTENPMYLSVQRKIRNQDGSPASRHSCNFLNVSVFRVAPNGELTPPRGNAILKIAFNDNKERGASFKVGQGVEVEVQVTCLGIGDSVRCVGVFDVFVSADRPKS